MQSFDEGWGYKNSEHLHLKILDKMYDPCLFLPGPELEGCVAKFLTVVQAEVERQLFY